MPHTERTLALSADWNLRLDASGGILVEEMSAQAVAQDVANECRLFINDAYFQQDKGTPYFLVELGRLQAYPQSILRAYLRAAALRVPQIKEVLSVDIFSFDTETRQVTGEITFTLKDNPNAQLTAQI